MRFQSHLATFYQLRWRDFPVGGRNGWNGNRLILGIPSTGKSPLLQRVVLQNVRLRRTFNYSIFLIFAFNALERPLEYHSTMLNTC